MDIREQLKIRRDTLSTLETDSPVTQEMIDDAFVLANFSRRSSDQSKYSQLRRLFEYQKDAEEAKNSQPQPEVEPVTKEQVSEAAKKAKESPTIENLAAHSKLKRSYTAQEEEKEAERLAKMPKHDPVAEAEAAKAAEEASRVEYAEFLGNQRRKTIDAKVRTALGLNR